MAVSPRPLLVLLALLVVSSVLCALLPPGPRDVAPRAQEKPPVVVAIR